MTAKASALADLSALLDTLRMRVTAMETAGGVTDATTHMFDVMTDMDAKLKEFAEAEMINTYRVPLGFKIVPDTPTQEMADAAGAVFVQGLGFNKMWTAALEKAPKPPVPRSVDVDIALEHFERAACTPTYRMREGVIAVLDWVFGVDDWQKTEVSEEEKLRNRSRDQQLRYALAALVNISHENTDALSPSQFAKRAIRHIDVKGCDCVLDNLLLNDMQIAAIQMGVDCLTHNGWAADAQALEAVLLNNEQNRHNMYAKPELVGEPEMRECVRLLEACLLLFNWPDLKVVMQEAIINAKRVIGEKK